LHLARSTIDRGPMIIIVLGSLGSMTPGGFHLGAAA
jgi:hypothetical protein